MRSFFRIVVLCCFAVASVAALAQSGASSNGQFQFSLTGATGSIQFDGRVFGSGGSGQMTFSATSDVSAEDSDGEPDSVAGATSTNLTLTVKFDCVKVQGNRAAMSGVVTSSSQASAVGSRALLAVEDGGEGRNAAPDKFTWGLYRNIAQTWTPSDYEVPGDAGALFNWHATDAERSDDVGIPARQSTTVNCSSFPVGAYALEELPHGAGNIQVKP
jgi:hypothetical protein